VAASNISAMLMVRRSSTQAELGVVFVLLLYSLVTINARTLHWKNIFPDPSPILVILPAPDWSKVWAPRDWVPPSVLGIEDNN